MWTATVTTDSDKTDVGTATAIWDNGLGDTFTYSRRAKMTTAEKAAFVAEAKAALANRDTIRARDLNLSTLLTTALNA